VTNYGAATVSLIDLGTLAVSAVAVGSFPAGVAIAGGRAWVANRGDDTVSVVDLATATLVTTVTVGEAPRGVTAGGGRVFVGSLNDATVSVLDVTTAAILATWALPNPSPTDLLLSTAGDRLYAAHPTADLVSVLDTATGLPLASLPAPHGLAVFAGISQLGSGAQVDIPGLTLPGLLAIAALLAALGFARLRGALLLLVLVAAAAVVPAAAEAQVSFIDDDFDDADWVIEQASVGNGSQLAEQSGFIGDPAPSRRMEHESPGTAGPPEVVAAVHRFTGGGYDPASQGAIASLDATWRRIVTLNDNGGDVEEAFVVIQGGVVFATAASAFSASFWEDAFRPGLVAADFSDGGGAHPDFSTAGAPLFFGYLRRTSNSTPFSSFVEHCIDRFEVEVDNGTPPGPGPGTLELVAFEFTGVIDPARITVVRRDGTNGPASVQVHVHRNGVSLVQDAQWADGEGGGREVTFDLLDFVGPHTLVAFDVDLEDPQPSPGGPALGRRRAMLDFSGDPALADRARLLATGPAALLVLAPLALWLAQRRRRSAAAARPPSAP
jgi:YVTN family beta-propeller protein